MSDSVAVRSRFRRGWAWAVAWTAATICVLLFARRFDLHAILAELSRAKAGWLVLAVVAFFVVLPLLTEQWVRLLPVRRPVRWSVIWECVTLSLAAMNILPFGGGHALAAGLLARRAGIGLEGGVSLMALEQLCEAFTKAALLGVTLVAAPLPPEWRTGTWTLAAALLAGALAAVILAQRAAYVSPPVGTWRYRWAHHLEALRSPRTLIVALALGVAMKVAQVAAIYAVQRSLGVVLPISTLPLILTAVSVATLVSVSPGNLGVYEAAAFAAYRWVGVPAEQALALGLVQHACYLLPTVGTGYAVTVWKMFKRPAV